MNKALKEIALRVWQEIHGFDAISMRGDVIAFAEKLLAAMPKPEPVPSYCSQERPCIACFANDGECQSKPEPFRYWRDGIGGDEYCEKPFTTDWIPLYTALPDQPTRIAELETEVERYRGKMIANAERSSAYEAKNAELERQNAELVSALEKCSKQLTRLGYSANHADAALAAKEKS